MKRNLNAIGGLMVGGLLVMCMVTTLSQAADGGAPPAKPADPFVKGAVPVPVVAAGGSEAAAVTPAPPAAEAAAQDQDNVQIEVNVSLVSFPREDMESLARESDSAAVSEEQIIKAWRNGKGHLVASHKVVAPPGQEVQCKGVAEHISPTSFERLDEQGTNQVTKALPRLIPSNFETRETGFVVTYTASLHPDGNSVDVTMAPEYVVRLDDHEILTSIGPEGGAALQTKVYVPEFFNRKISFTRSVMNGQTAVQGGMLNPEGTEMGYFFVTPKLIKHPM